MRRFPRLLLLLLPVYVGIFPLSASAQQDTATMTGTVKDPSGATVPKATVTITNIGTNISVRTMTDEMGFYTAASLRAGEYSVTAESAGFSRSSGQG